MKQRILFYVLHLLGVGHVHRVHRLIKGMTARGLEVDIIYGGYPLNIDFSPARVFHLPPIAAQDETYQSYIDDCGNPLTDEYMDNRCNVLMSHFADLEPDMIIMEAFPFGRRIVRNELTTLLDAVKSRTKNRTNSPLVVTSLRDILESRKNPERYEETRDLVLKYVDHILVHSDPNIIALDSTYPLTESIADKITYTGFVTPSLTDTELATSYDIIVSVGGGAFGFDLVSTALDVASSDRFSHLKWCLTTGPNMPKEKIEKLQKRVSDHIHLVEHLDNLGSHIRQARYSISQCGYNTAMDVLTAPQCKAIFVPYDTQGQSEQVHRSELLANSGLSIHLAQSQLTAQSLTQALDDADNLVPIAQKKIDFSGVATCAEQVHHWLKEK